MGAAPREPGGSSGAVAVVGFMGAGKSAVGRLVAARLGLPFVDSDALVEERHGRIPDLFADGGEAAFRRLERDMVLEAAKAARDKPCVLALGGGAVQDPEVRRALRALPHVVWLRAPAETLWRRVRCGAPCERPLARDEETFAALLAAREAWYREVASVVVDDEGALTEEDVAEEVVARVAGEACGARQGDD